MFNKFNEAPSTKEKCRDVDSDSKKLHYKNCKFSILNHAFKTCGHTLKKFWILI